MTEEYTKAGEQYADWVKRRNVMTKAKEYAENEEAVSKDIQSYSDFKAN